MSQKKKKSIPRNPYVLPAKRRKGGPMKNKKDKRAEENKHPNYTDENL